MEGRAPQPLPEKRNILVAEDRIQAVAPAEHELLEETQVFLPRVQKFTILLIFSVFLL